MPKPPSSARTSSSHRSSLEPRGPPEFDREYARQLSLAKRGRSSLKTSPRTDLDGASPGGGEGLSPLPEMSSSRYAKDAAAPQVSPRRPDRPGLPLGRPRGSEDPLASLEGSSRPNSGPRALSATQSCVDLPAAPDTAPAPATPEAAGADNDSGDDRSFRPNYFSRGGATSAVVTGRDDVVAYKPVGVDRLVPQFNRQVALRMRRTLRAVSQSAAPIRWITTAVGDVVRGARLCTRACDHYVVRPIVSVGGNVGAAVGQRLRSVAAAISPTRWLSRGTSKGIGSGAARGKGLALVSSGLSRVYQAAVVTPMRLVRLAVVRPPQAAYYGARSFCSRVGSSLKFFVSRAPKKRAPETEATPASPLETPPPTATPTAVVKKSALSTTRPSLTAAMGAKTWNSTREVYRKAHRVMSRFGQSLMYHTWHCAERLWQWARGFAARWKPAPRNASRAEAPQRNGAAAQKPVMVTKTEEAIAHVEHTLAGDLWGSLLREQSDAVRAAVEKELRAALRIPAKSKKGSPQLRNVKLAEGSLRITFDLVRTVSVTAAKDDTEAMNAQVEDAAQALETDATQKLKAHPFKSLMDLYNKAVKEAAAKEMAERAADEKDRAAKEAAAERQGRQVKEAAARAASPCDLLAQFTENSSTTARAECAKELLAVCGSVEPSSENKEKDCTDEVAVAQSACESGTKGALQQLRIQCKEDVTTAVEKAKADCLVRTAASAEEHQKHLADLTTQHAEELAARQAKCDTASKEVEALRVSLARAQGAQKNESAAVAKLRAELQEQTAKLARCQDSIGSMGPAAECHAETEKKVKEAVEQCQARAAEAATKSCDTQLQDAVRHAAETAAAEWAAKMASAKENFTAACAEQLNAQRTSDAAALEATVAEHETALAACRAEMMEALTKDSKDASAALQDAKTQVASLQAKLSHTKESCDARLTAAVSACAANVSTAVASAREACEAQVASVKESDVREAAKNLEEARAVCTAARMQAERDCSARTQEAVQTALQEAEGKHAQEREGLQRAAANQTSKQRHELEQLHNHTGHMTSSVVALAQELNQQCAQLCRDQGGPAEMCGKAMAMDVHRLVDLVLKNTDEMNASSLVVAEFRRLLLGAYNATEDTGGRPDGLNKRKGAAHTASLVHPSHCKFSWHPIGSEAARTTVPDARRPSRLASGVRAFKKATVALVMGAGVSWLAVFAYGQHQRAQDLAATNIELAKALNAAKARASVATEAALHAGTDRSTLVSAASAIETVDTTTAWMEQAVVGYFEVMAAWHLTCCSLLAEHEMRDTADGAKDGASEGRGPSAALLSPPSSDVDASSESLGTMPYDKDAAHRSPASESDVALARLSAAPAASPERLDDEAGLICQRNAGPMAALMSQSAHVYFSTLESYYVDLLEAVTNRELVERQLEEMEGVAAKQAAILERQGGTVTKLQRTLDETRDTHQREVEELTTECNKLRRQLAAAETDPSGSSDELAKARRMISLQAEMVSVLEEQLKRVGVTRPTSPGRSPMATRQDPSRDMSDPQDALRTMVQREGEEKRAMQEELSRLREGSRLTPRSSGRPRTVSAVSSHNSNNSSGATPVHGAGDHAVPSSMVRDRGNVRRYRQLDWQDLNDDDNGMQPPL